MAQNQTVLRSGFIPILIAVRAQIVAAGRFPDAHIFLAAREVVPKLDGEQSIVLRPRNLQAERANDGGGRVHCVVRRRLSVVCRTRGGELDETGSDLALLTDATLGLLALEETVLDALQDFWPEDRAGNQLTEEPMRLLADQEPAAGKSAGWGELVQDYEILYALNLDQARQ